MDSFDSKLAKCQNSDHETTSLSYSTKHDTNCEKSLNTSLDENKANNLFEKTSYPKSVNSYDNLRQFSDSENYQNTDIESELNKGYYTNQYLQTQPSQNSQKIKI